MSVDTVSRRLEGLLRVIQAARDTEHAHETDYIRGLNKGLQLALDEIEREMRWARELEAAVAEAGGGAS